MTATPTPHPGIVLATDRTARCDRALETATRLARASALEPAAVTVVEPTTALLDEVGGRAPAWYEPPSPHVRAERELHRDLVASGLAWRTRVLDDAQALVAAVEQERARLSGAETLIVSGPVREGAFGAVRLGSTLDRLLRLDSARVLIVRQHPRADYRHVLVSSDFSAPSKIALQAARALFPAARISLLHGFDVPLLGFVGDGREAMLASTRERLLEEANGFLREAAVDPDTVERVVEYGDPARLMQLYCETFDPDLLVCGTHGHGALFELVLGSVARSMAMRARIDTLLVRA